MSISLKATKKSKRKIKKNIADELKEQESIEVTKEQAEALQNR